MMWKYNIYNTGPLTIFSHDCKKNVFCRQACASICERVVVVVTDNRWIALEDSSCRSIPASAQVTQRIAPMQDSSRTAFLPSRSPLPQITLFWPGYNWWSVCLCCWLRGIISNPCYMGLNRWRENGGNKSGQTRGRTRWEILCGST